MDSCIITPLLLKAKNISFYHGFKYYYRLDNNISIVHHKSSVLNPIKLQAVEILTKNLYSDSQILLKLNIDDLWQLQWEAKSFLLDEFNNENYKLWKNIFPECNKNYYKRSNSLKVRVSSLLLNCGFTKFYSFIRLMYGNL